MELWIARDCANRLYIFDHEPVPDYYGDRKYWELMDFHYIHLHDGTYPEVTFENSPKRVELKLID